MGNPGQCLTISAHPAIFVAARQGAGEYGLQSRCVVLGGLSLTVSFFCSWKPVALYGGEIHRTSVRQSEGADHPDSDRDLLKEQD